MSIVLRRIQGEIGALELCGLRNVNRGCFTETLQQLPEHVIQRLALNYRLLHFDYRIQCAQIVNDLSHQTTQPIDAINARIKDALALSELLAYLYQYYNDIPCETARLKRDQRIYRQWLNKPGYFAWELIPEQKHSMDCSYSQSIREFTIKYNFFRLFSVRLRRFMLALSLAFPQFEAYRRCVQGLDFVFNPLLSYVGWIFFIPRLLNHLVFMAKHVIPGSWMPDEEKKLGWQARFKLQIERRWYELGNDLAWLTVGLINCFVFTGVLAPMAVYLGVVLQGFDLVWACIRAWVETNHMQNNHSQYERMMNDSSLTHVEKNEVRAHLEFSEACMAYEKKKLQLRILNTVVMLIAVGLGMPLLAVNPFLPLIGGIIAVLASGFIYAAGKKIEQNKLPEAIPALKEKTHETYSLTWQHYRSSAGPNVKPEVTSGPCGFFSKTGIVPESYDPEAHSPRGWSSKGSP